ncbi:MAG: hypothetical protein HYY84_03740 [Deltaproteobacteria bacterium]|nr:hypothetical protein [Deltaproteobacteria bacterium]
MKKVNAGFIAAVTLVAVPAVAQVPVASSYTNEAWKVTRDWDEKSTEAGIAWAANSGLNWQQKFAAWIQSMKKIARYGEEGSTFEMTTPYGKTLPAPVLDCADGAMAMRVIFASWYGLPVLVKAGSNYYGHFGVKRGSATKTSDAICAKSLCDFSHYTATDIATKPWPTYSKLASKSVGSDANPALGGVTLGGYLDQLLLNKRVGYVVVALLTGAGSMNLAGSTNLYDIKPEAIQAGDVLLERWQAQGIGHTILMKSVTPSGGKIRVESAAGWLPPRQLKWQGPFDTFELLTDETTGGSECTDYSSSCAPNKTYAAFGGGIKRWRAPKKVGGKWTLKALTADASIAISGTDYVTLGKRPGQFENLLYLPPATELRDEIIAAINAARSSLRNKPSGCAARDRREDAFGELYELGAISTTFNMTRLAIDKTYRKVEDYVFWPLDYTKSPTCCWNGSTAQMGASVVATAKAQGAKNPCAEPLAFKKINNDYAFYRTAATGVTWKAYSNDENCSQGTAANDVEKTRTATPYCTIRSFIRE